MSNDQLQQRKERAETEPLVISQIDEGFRVFSATSPGTTYVVSGSPEAPACTCRDFEYHRSEPGFRCKHIFAVLSQLESPVDGAETDPIASEERRVIEAEGRLWEKKRSPAKANGAPQMVLKRSVNPDRRIDSLSVEFACPIDKASADKIKSQAVNTLRLQADIVDSFLGNQNGGNGSGPETGPRSETDGAVPAQMLNIGGMNGRWGPRLFINVQVNGHVAKLFGNRKWLVRHVKLLILKVMAEEVGFDEAIILKLLCNKRIAAMPTTYIECPKSPKSPQSPLIPPDFG